MKLSSGCSQPISQCPQNVFLAANESKILELTPMCEGDKFFSGYPINP